MHLFGAHHKSLKESGKNVGEGLRFVRIFVCIPWRGASNDSGSSGVVRTGNF